MSNYRVFTVYMVRWQVQETQGHNLGKLGPVGHPASLLKTFRGFRALRR